jgi:hypothetical protein
VECFVKSLFLSVLLCLFFAGVLFAQDSPLAVKTFDNGGLKFNYPADWTITDKSTPELQTLFLSKSNTSLLIILSSPREFLADSQQYINFQRDSYARYTKGIAKTLNAVDKKAKEEWLCLDLNGRNIGGTKLSGFYKDEPTTGEIYPFALGNRFITLVYMRADKESGYGNSVWNSLVKSLYLEGSNKEVTGRLINSEGVEAGVVNGRAINLVKPPYSRNASGTVEVQVEIDETGKVVSAKAVSGNNLLYNAAEFAAKSSKFSPTRLCDKAIRVTGIIVYNFLP